MIKIAENKKTKQKKPPENHISTTIFILQHHLQVSECPVNPIFHTTLFLPRQRTYFKPYFNSSNHQMCTSPGNNREEEIFRDEKQHVSYQPVIFLLEIINILAKLYLSSLKIILLNSVQCGDHSDTRYISYILYLKPILNK